MVCVAEAGREADCDRFMQAAVALLLQRDISAQGHVLAGRPYEQILQAAQRLGADLIVMGSRGDTHLGRALIGGVAGLALGRALYQNLSSGKRVSGASTTAALTSTTLPATGA